MYAICSTKQDDVLNHVREMEEKGYRFRIIQLGQKLQRSLDNNRNQVPDAADKRTDRYSVNILTRTLHKKDCKAIQSKKLKMLVDATIINAEKTGLKLCKSCMG